MAAHKRVSSFNPRAPRGARPDALTTCAALGSFNPRAPRGARRFQGLSGKCVSCFNPRAPRGARPRSRNAPPNLGVSIRAPHGGRDVSIVAGNRVLVKFQSARPTGGATHDHTLTICWVSFNPRAPRGARHRARWQRRRGKCFNPRAPRGARRYGVRVKALSKCFNPRAPRGARLWVALETRPE